MKTVILAGGLGTRLSEETSLKPKPMVEIGEFPILWHIMKIYEKYQHTDFVVALGYKSEVIKQYFIDYQTSRSDFNINLSTGNLKYLNSNLSENWNISLINTGLNTLTGGRLLRLREHINSTFMLTYGDGVADIDISKLIKFHKSHGKIATVTAVRPRSRFGGIVLDGNEVKSFEEKPLEAGNWVNGGFFVFEPSIFEYITDDSSILERKPLEQLASEGQLMCFKHEGFWQCMDTLRDKNYLNELYNQSQAAWLK
jgi:glucose-1-phosphate cytidylyltransferase